MDIKLSKSEIAEIAGEVVKELKRSGLVVKAGTSQGAGPARRGRPRKVAAAVVPSESGYSIATAADAADRHPMTIRMDIKSGRLKAKKVKGAYLISPKDLQRYLQTPKYARSGRTA